MSDEQFQMLYTLVIQPLKEEGAEVFIFGSRAMGTHHPYSDVDILYRISQDLPAGVISRIKEAIEDSRFPFTIDLVAQSDLAASYLPSVLSQLCPL